MYQKLRHNIGVIYRLYLACIICITSSTSCLCPIFGALGCTSAIVFTCFGAAYGTAKAGTGLSAMGVLRPDLVMKAIVPIVMAGIIGIYGLVVSVLISDGLKQEMALFTGFIQLVGDAGVRATAQQPRLFVGMILILISPKYWVFMV
ncbi:unnamed protein product [Rhizophagus irregularis]|nr:unnamed protein product [Rhizophagus irregularis]